MSEIIRVGIVEDQTMVSELLGSAVSREPDLQLVGTAPDADAGRRLALRERPDVLVVDFQLGTVDGVELIVGVAPLLPGTRYLIVSGYRPAEVARRAIAAGCHGFLPKTGSVPEMVAAIRSVAAGESVFRPEDLAAALRSDPRQDPSALSPREVDVLALLGEGKSTRAMAQELFISEHTVRSHVRQILQKLGAHSKVEAVAAARRRGLL